MKKTFHWVAIFALAFSTAAWAKNKKYKTEITDAEGNVIGQRKVVVDENGNGIRMKEKVKSGENRGHKTKVNLQTGETKNCQHNQGSRDCTRFIDRGKRDVVIKKPEPLKMPSLAPIKMPSLTPVKLSIETAADAGQKHQQGQQQAIVTHAKKEATFSQAEMKKAWNTVPTKLSKAQQVAFGKLDCKGEKFHLSQIEPDPAKRRILTGGSDFDPWYRGDKTRAICKDPKYQ
ncbi:MAG: hypothetical protein JNL01_05740 [Bdellovibrionales bacterium]|nr:hypothetical protein [Bdellovibrionales bacterium]